MEAQLNEANTFPSQSYAQSFFTRLPTDNRFLQRGYVSVPMKTGLSGNTITFQADKFLAANVYMIQDTCLEVRMVMTKANGHLPDTNAFVAPRNNVLHTLFETCRLYINDILITTNSSEYHYKAYILTLLTFPVNVKGSLLQTSGFFADNAGHFNDCSSNMGFIERNKLFRVGGSVSNPYRDSGAEFFGKLFHDLIACDSGLPPNTTIRFELDMAPAAFVLQCPDTDKEKYKYEITRAALYIPVAQLSLSVYNELSNLMAKTSEGSVALHYRRLTVSRTGVQKGNQDHYFQSLLANGECPCKVVICFVETEAKAGSYHKNPFEFRRSWTYQKANSEAVGAPENEHRESEIAELTEKIKKLETMHTEFVSTIETREDARDQRLVSKFENIAENFMGKMVHLMKMAGGSSSQKQPTQSEGVQGVTADGNERMSSFLKHAESTGAAGAARGSSDGPEILMGPPLLPPSASQMEYRTQCSHGGDSPQENNGRAMSRSSSTCSEFGSAPSTPWKNPTASSSAATTGVQYIKNMSLHINATPIDQV